MSDYYNVRVELTQDGAFGVFFLDRAFGDAYQFSPCRLFYYYSEREFVWEGFWYLWVPETFSWTPLPMSHRVFGEYVMLLPSHFLCPGSPAIAISGG